MIHNYSALRVATQAGVARVTIDNGPVNALDVTLMRDLLAFLASVHEDEAVKVIVFDSAVPDFFIAHVDMTLIDAPDSFDDLAKDVPAGMNVFQYLGETLRRQPQVTIVKLAGIARGGGAEFVAAADMCFAAIGPAGLAQCEALMGIVPGGGGTQYLSERMTRNRALEVVVGADLFDAQTAERYGWINRALPAEQLEGFVTRLANNIAQLPSGVVGAAKRALPQSDLSVGYAREHAAWFDLFVLPAASELIRGGIKAGAQTHSGELELEALMRRVNADRTVAKQVSTSA